MRESAKVAYQQVKRLVEETGRKNAIAGLQAIEHDSAFQQEARNVQLSEVAAVLHRHFGRTLDEAMDDSSDAYHRVDLGCGFLKKYEEFLKNRRKLVHVSKRLGDCGTLVLPLVEDGSPLVGEHTDMIMTEIVHRIAQGRSPVDLREMEDFEDDEPDRLHSIHVLQDIGWDVRPPVTRKIPVDILFKRGEDTEQCVRVVPDTILTYLEQLFKAWSTYPLDIESLGSSPPLRTGLQIPVGPKREFKMEVLRESVVVSPANVAIDTRGDLQPLAPLSLSLKNMFEGASRGGRRTVEVIDAIRSLLLILEELLVQVLTHQKSTNTMLAHPLLVLTLAIFIQKRNHLPGRGLRLFDDISKVLVRQCGANSLDPLWLEQLLRNYLGQVRVAVAKCLKRNVLVESLEALMHIMLSELPVFEFTCFDSKVAVKRTRDLRGKQTEVANLLCKWIRTFGEDFCSQPSGSVLENKFWNEFACFFKADLVKQKGLPKLEDPPLPIDTSVNIRPGKKSQLKPALFFYETGQYPFDPLDMKKFMQDFEGKTELLWKVFGRRKGQTDALPLPCVWELLGHRILSQGTDHNKELGVWVTTGVRSKLEREVVDALLPRHSYKFKKGWFTGAKKIAFHLLLATGDMDKNIFQSVIGLNDLFKIMNRNFLVWQRTPKEYQDALKARIPMFATLTPLLGISKQVSQLVDLWKHLYDHHHALLLEPPENWISGIQVENKQRQRALFDSFSTQTRVRVHKTLKEQSGAKMLLTAMLHVHATLDRGGTLFRDSLSRFARSLPVDGGLLLEAFTWCEMSFLYTAMITQGLRTQNLSHTQAMNPSTLLTPAMILNGMEKETYCVECKNVYSKNHQTKNSRMLPIDLKSVYEEQLDKVPPLQTWAIRLFVLQKLIFDGGYRGRKTAFSLNSPQYFCLDQTQLKKRDWRDERPKAITERTWTTLGSFIHKSFIPTSLRLQSVTPNKFRKLLVSMEIPSGVAATKQRTGHKTTSSLAHYVLSLPWLNSMLRAHDEKDRPLLARSVLTFQTEYIRKHRRPPSQKLILQMFTPMRLRQITQTIQASHNKGVSKQYDKVEYQFWALVQKLDVKDFAINLETFRSLMRQAIALSPPLPKPVLDSEVEDLTSIGLRGGENPRDGPCHDRVPAGAGRGGEEPDQKPRAKEGNSLFILNTSLGNESKIGFPVKKYSDHLNEVIHLF